MLTSEGTVEMEACIMDGKTKKCGAVSGLKTVVNAISLARLVMEKTPHIYLAFDGAEAFAREQVSLSEFSLTNWLLAWLVLGLSVFSPEIISIVTVWYFYFLVLADYIRISIINFSTKDENYKNY